ncbi:MAG TPA: hypothetical protein VFP53_06055 [Sphingomicrobium sp.]|nr:hypothetical protein [Sphingomicrobium sp.]
MGKSGVKSGELTIVGGAAPKARKRSKRDWTRAKEQAFVEALAETCNLTRAAEAAGVSTSGARQRRKTNAAFRASCCEAIASAYQRLELAILERSLNGSEKIVVRKDGSEERIRDYPNAVALTLLRMHRDTAAEAMNEPDEQDIEEVRERIFQKLQRLRKRTESGK